MINRMTRSVTDVVPHNTKRIIHNNNKLYLDTLSREETLFKGVYSWYINYTD